MDSSQGLQKLAHIIFLYHKGVGVIIITFYGFVITIEGEFGGLGCQTLPIPKISKAGP